MALSIDDLNATLGSIYYDTSNEYHKLTQKYEKQLRTPKYKLLGFLNDYMYSYDDGYLVKCDLSYNPIIKILLDVEQGIFHSNKNFMYFYKDDILYQIDDNLMINWSIKFDDDIRLIDMDDYGNVFVLCEISRTIKKISKDGEIILMVAGTELSAVTRLYSIYISEGSHYMYILGSSFIDGSVDVFIDQYNAKTGEKLKTMLVEHVDGVKEYDKYYSYNNFIVKSNGIIYIYGYNEIKKLTTSMIPIWTVVLGMNPTTKNLNRLKKLNYDDSKYEDYICFQEDYYETNGYGLGKLDTNGKLLWKISTPGNINLIDIDFQLNVYQGDLFIAFRQGVNLFNTFLLAVNDERILYETLDGDLVRILEDNSEEYYNPDNYYGYRLLFDTLKEGVPKYIAVPLIDEDGYALKIDNENLLLITADNPAYSDPENYIYKYALSSGWRYDSIEQTFIKTKSGSILKTLFGNYLEKLNTEELTDVIEELDGGLVRYEDTNYLLVDRFKFFNQIITKKYGYDLITKANGDKIITKKRQVFKYILRRLSDVDIIVEFIKKSGLLDTDMNKYVERLKQHTLSALTTSQTLGVPYYADLQLSKRKSYWYDGVEYPAQNTMTQIYLVNNLPYINQRYHRPLMIDSMVNLVQNQEILPFLLFIDGKCIRWTNMAIIRDYHYSYIIISNIPDKDETTTSSIVFPCRIRYAEDSNTTIDPKYSFVFDENGLLTNNTKASIIMEIIDENIVCDGYEFNNTKQYFDESNLVKYSQSITDKNYFIFEDKKYYHDTPYYLTDHGDNIYTYDRLENINIQSFDVRFYFYINAVLSKDIIYKIPNQEKVKSDIVDNIIEAGVDTEYLDNFIEHFEFAFSKYKSYNTNIAEALSYIFRYDMSLILDYYKDHCNMKSYTYTAEEIQTNLNRQIGTEDEGYLVMSRNRRTNNYCYDDKIIVFINNELYDDHNNIIYEADRFKVPIDTINDNDVYEILHFRYVHNDHYFMNVPDPLNIYLTEFVRNNNLRVFANSPEGLVNVADYDENNNMQFPVEVYYKNNYDKNNWYLYTTIEFETIGYYEKYYKNKLLNVASSRQFQYHHIEVDLINDPDTGAQYISLPPRFKFCKNINQYFVMIDGVKVDKGNYDLVYYNQLPNEQRFCFVWLKDIPTNGQRIDIFYLPEEYDEIVFTPEDIIKDGNSIVLNMDKMEFPFDKDLYMLFINGKKINPLYITNINIHTLLVESEIIKNEIISNITILKCINLDTVMRTIFSYGDVWSNSVDSLSPEKYKELFNLSN